ncbi:plasmid mobilization protein [Bradyrhizobium elkanii]|uniref:plasmid mobilization protein n=1 Tax=Bradyrhizobium elkanii TaxID=29448 RepID=UPI00351895E2
MVDETKVDAVDTTIRKRRLRGTTHADDRRDVVAKVLFTNIERAEVERRANAAGMTLGHYIRMAALDMPDAINIDTLVDEMMGIGAALNDMTRTANARRYIPGGLQNILADVAALLGKLDRYVVRTPELELGDIVVAPGDRRDIVQKIRLTTAEKAALDRRSEDADLTLSRYLRMAALGQRVVLNINALIAELSAIGNNLAQLMRVAAAVKFTPQGLSQQHAAVSDMLLNLDSAKR